MSAAERLQEAILAGCTRDDHDHVADYRAEVLRDFLGRLENAAGESIVEQLLAHNPELEKLAEAGKDTGDATQAAPDLLSVVSAALSAGQGPLLPLPTGTRRLLAARVTDAVTPLVAYRPVWDSSLPPGGRVCSICGQPVESEPCAEHSPGFFLPGRTYTDPDPVNDWAFRCDTVTTRPDDGTRTALGWRRIHGQWEPYSYDEDDWEIHQVAGIAEASDGGGSRG